MKSRKDDIRKGDAISLKDAIYDLLEAYRIRGKYDQSYIINHWNAMMGETIANRTTRIFFKDETLFVELSSSALKNELSMSKEKVVTLLNKEIGRDVVKKVVFL
jgi:predicted nucleic acid-binding Zn ribbon protein